jgi:hypothetical protein
MITHSFQRWLIIPQKRVVPTIHCLSVSRKLSYVVHLGLREMVCRIASSTSEHHGHYQSAHNHSNSDHCHIPNRHRYTRFPPSWSWKVTQSFTPTKERNETRSGSHRRRSLYSFYFEGQDQYPGSVAEQFVFCIWNCDRIVHTCTYLYVLLHSMLVYHTLIYHLILLHTFCHEYVQGHTFCFEYVLSQILLPRVCNRYIPVHT